MLAIDSKPFDRWQPDAAQPWNARRVVHLYRRAGFGATWKEIQSALNVGPQATIDRLLRGDLEAAGDREFESLSQVIRDAAVASNNIQRLQAWWILRMLRSADPLGERLALMWHNHFATSYDKVQSVALMRDQNEILRKHARAPFRALLTETIKEPAMLLWLDADANRRQHPNENLAREIMELFTLGVYAFRAVDARHASSTQPGDTSRGYAQEYDYYTEADIQEAARALTGWTVTSNGFRMHIQQHDPDAKTIFGKCGAWDGDDLLHMLIDHPATPERLAWRICHEFMGESCIDPLLIAALTEQLASTDLDIGHAVATLLRSQAFFDEANIGSKVASPIELAVSWLRSLEMLEPPPSTLLLSEWTLRMGQSLFRPPNVFGWPGGRSWLTTRTVISRANFAQSMLQGQLHDHPHSWQPVALALRNGVDTLEKQQEFFIQLLGCDSPDEPRAEIDIALDAFLYSLLTSPQAQLL